MKCECGVLHGVLEICVLAAGVCRQRAHCTRLRKESLLLRNREVRGRGLFAAGDHVTCGEEGRISAKSFVEVNKSRGRETSLLYDDFFLVCK